MITPIINSIAAQQGSPMSAGLPNSQSTWGPPPQLASTAQAHGFQNTPGSNNADCAIGEEGDSPFPRHCLPDKLKAIVVEVAAAAAVPICLPAICALGAVSAALGAGIEIETDGLSTLRANLYIIITASSGTGKSEASKAILAPLMDHENEMLDKWRVDKLPSLKAGKSVIQRKIESLQKSICKLKDSSVEQAQHEELVKLQKQLEEIESKLLEPRYSVADVTAEKLAEVLSRGTREAIASLSADARGCIDVLAGKYNKMTDESVYLSGFSGDSCKYDRIHRPTIRLRRPCLSLLWLLQPDKLQEVINHKSIQDSGFWPRCLLVHSGATRQIETGQRHVMNREATENWRQLIRTLVSQIHDASSIHTVRATPEVIELFREYNNRIVTQLSPGGPFADIDSYAARWKELAWRILLVIHVAHYGADAPNRPLDLSVAQLALTLMDWFIGQQLNVLSASREKKRRKRYDALVEILSNAPGCIVTLRDMKRRHGFDEDELVQLETHHGNELRIEKVQSSGPGRPSSIIKLI